MAKRQPRERIIKDNKKVFTNPYVLVECIWCGKDHWITKYDYKEEKKLFCSVTCSNDYIWANDPIIQQYNYRRNKNKKKGLEIEKPCEHCGEFFWIRYDKFLEGKGHFCSRKCAMFFRRLNDGNKIVYGFENGHFCWSVERADWLYFWRDDTGEAKKMLGPKALWLLHNREIPKGMYVKNSNPNKLEINISDLFLDYHPRYRGIENQNYPKEYFEIRPCVLYRDNYTCQVCGNNEDLHVHHINRNKKDNDINNLITLCQSCHHQIHFKNMEVLYDDIFVFRYLLGE